MRQSSIPELIAKLESLAQRPVTPPEGRLAHAKALELRAQLPHCVKFSYSPTDWFRLAGRA